MIAAAPDLDGLRHHPMAEPTGGLYPTPHSPLFDFEATTAGAEWIDAYAEAASAHVDVGRRVVAHTDWSARNVRLSATGVRAVYDLDSLSSTTLPAALAGAAMSWRAFGETSDGPAPGVEEAGDWLADYPEPLDPDEQRAFWAHALFHLAYTARCEHAVDPHEGAVHPRPSHPSHGRPCTPRRASGECVDGRSGLAEHPAHGRGASSGACAGAGQAAGGFPALPPLEVPPLPVEGPAEAEAGAVVDEPVGGAPVADVDRQALHVHRALGREDPPQRLRERSPLLHLGVQHGRLLRGGPEPRGDRQPVAGVGGRGLGPLERVDQAGIEAGGHRRRGGGRRRGRSGRRGAIVGRRARSASPALASVRNRVPRTAASTTSRPSGARRRRSRRWRSARSCWAMEGTR